MTTLNEAKVSIIERFDILWNNRTPYPVDNEKFTEPENTAWARLTVRNTGGGQQTLGESGNRKYERNGSIFVQIFTPKETGTEQADTLSRAALTIFEGTRFDGVVVNNAVIREIGSQIKWYQVQMEASFLYNEIK